MRLRALLWLTAALSAAALPALAANDLAGRQAPDFVLPSSTGPNIRLSEYRGQIVMLAFGAGRCSDCRTQLAELADTYERYRSAGVALLVVSLDRDPRDAAQMARTGGAAYPVLSDAAGQVGRQYDVDAMPALVLIDRDGVVREVFEGYRRGREEEYLEKLREMLREL